MTLRQWILFSFIALLISACGVLPQAPTATPTRDFGVPTLQASPTTLIRNSDEIYGDSDVGQNNLTAAALPNGGALPPLQSGTRVPSGAEQVQLVLDDGTILTGSLYSQLGATRRVTGVLLLGASVDSWGLLPSTLVENNMTALVVEVPNTRAANLDAILTSLSEFGTVDPSRIVVIGEQQYADMALLGCAEVPICDAIVMFSPISRDSLLNVLPNFNPRSLFVIASRADAQSYATAVSLANDYAAGSQFVEVAAGQGANILSLNSDLSRQISVWINETLN